MKFFFSCDWGTSAFRLRLVDAETLHVLSEIKTGHGIAAAFEQWKQTGKNEKSRVAFYQSYLFEQVKKIIISFSHSLSDTPVILSGMASSSIGMLELPYKELPFPCDGSGLILHTIPKGEDQPHKMIIISGAKSEADVMRGEETILMGCDAENNDRQQLFIFPGTHSKHVTVKNGTAENIATYMTGELFDLLSNKSILSASVKKNNGDDAAGDQYFIDGVIKGVSSNILNSIFHVRTNQLFKKATAQENYHYLSGLLIGHELKDAAEKKPAAITLVCGEGLKKEYELAMDILGLRPYRDYKNADDALVKGQWKIMRQHAYLSKDI